MPLIVDVTQRMPDRIWSLAPHGQGVLDALRRSDDPGSDLGPGPWTAVVQRPDGSIAAAASTDSGGLFWSRTGGPGSPLVFSDSVAEVVSARTEATNLDEDYLRGYLLLEAPAAQTPYLEVGRVPGGWTLTFPAGGGSEPTATQWCGPASWKEPTRFGATVREEYLRAFDAAVDSLVMPDGPLVATMSGGLDSTFVVASLVRHATRERPVHALCHSPHPAAGLRAEGNWDPDDYPVAIAMADAYPGLVEVHRILPEDADHPLDAALNGARRSWLPVFNPGNQIWLQRAAQHAASMGADRILTGGKGNASFSYDHTGRSPLRNWGSHAKALLLRRRDSYFTALGLPDARLRRPRGRAAFHRLLEPGSAWSAAQQPAAWPSALVDPFAARPLLDLAASITGDEWNRHGGRRGFARTLGTGRVPDSIRLRTRRGGQAWDSWFLQRKSRDRFIAEIEMLPGTPVLGGWVDHRAVRRTAVAWPWGEATGPPRIELIATERLLSLAAFIRLTSARLRQIDLR